MNKPRDKSDIIADKSKIAQVADVAIRAAVFNLVGFRRLYGDIGY